MPDRGLHTDRARAVTFGEDALQYDRARPSYPSELIDVLCERAPRAVLDVGCGTGIASRPFVERGCRVLGVEPDARMADVARSSGLEVDVATFEEWQPGDRRFDLLFSAQAWHWVEPDAGAAKAADVVVPEGSVAFFWNIGKPSDEMRQAFDRCYRQYAPELEEESVLRGHGASDRVTASTAALEREPRFAEPSVVSFRHSITYTTAQWLELLGTHSDHRCLGPQARSALFAAIGAEIDRLGGEVDLPYETTCVTAQRI